ncbi:MAG: hypothetical protein AAF399_09810 [Bacteroidota bacterium]
MKALLPLLFLLLSTQGFASNAPSSMETAPTTPEQTTNFRWDLLAAGSGVLGLVLAFVPVVSLIGVGLGIVAVGASILAFRKQQRKRWAWLGMITGGLTMLAFLSVIGLIAFF